MSSCSALNICSTIYAKRPQKSQRPQLSKKISSGAMVIIIKMNHKTRHHYKRLRSLAIKLFNKHPDKLNNFKNVVVKTGSFTALTRTNFIVFIYLLSWSRWIFELLFPQVEIFSLFAYLFVFFYFIV